MGNSFANMVLFGWPLVVLALFTLLPRAPALCISIVTGFLLLPSGTGLDLPGIPTLDKNSVTALSVGLALLLRLGPERRLPPARAPLAGVASLRTGPSGRPTLFVVMIGALLLSPLLTAATNTAPIAIGPRVLPGLGAYDAASLLLGRLLELLPFLLAFHHLRKPEHHALVLKVLVIAALVYSLPTLWEARMSPQLHRQIYGFFPHSFLQHMRSGGWRPLVFLNHGLLLAMFLASATLAAAALWRHRAGKGAVVWLAAAGWLLVTLILCNSLGALLIVAVLLPVALLLGPRTQIAVAALVALSVLVYPMLRAGGAVPVDRLVEMARSIDEDRAQSLEFRFTNEDILLDRAGERPLLGWGSWGRNRVYDETGRDISVTDGIWVIIFGSFGWVGYLPMFGLLTAPILLTWRHRRRLQPGPATAGLALIMAANLVDMLPNASLTPITWLLAGALGGRLAAFRAGADAAGPEVAGPAATMPRGARYSRFPAGPAADGPADQAPVAMRRKTSLSATRSS